MKFGLTQDQYDQVLTMIVSPLKQKGAKVFCYGSRARGDHKQFSDLDLMVESENEASLNLGSLHEKMQKSNFPFKIDLVHFSSFAESYKPGYQRDKVPFD